jgi:predicted nucleotidyltransferase
MKAKQVELLLREAQQDGEILAAMLFGSVARGEKGAQSRFFSNCLCMCGEGF